MSLLQCGHCLAQTSLSEAGARFLGWRVFEGQTQGGGMMRDVCCPACSGRTAPKVMGSLEQEPLFNLYEEE